MIKFTMLSKKRVMLFPGDCLESLKDIPSDSIDACITDPPYHLTSIVKRFGKAGSAPAKVGKTGAYARASKGFMGKQWDGGDIAMRPETWAEVLRVLKPGGHMACFGGTRTQHRMACAIEDAGFEIRDTVLWLYGTGFPKSLDVSKAIDKAAGAVRKVIGKSSRCIDPSQAGANGIGTFKETNWQESNVLTAPATPEAAQWEGWGSALKPAFEPILLCRKPLDGTIAANVLKHGVGGINIDACRVEADDKTPAPVGQYGGSAIGTTGHTGIRNSNADALGRFPANVMHDGSDEVMAAFAAFGEKTSGGGNRVSGNRQQEGYGMGVGPDRVFGANTGSAARFFYSAKAGKADRADSKHPTVKPVALIRWLCRLIVPVGGSVLDPFAGSGTTGQAALLEKAGNVVLCEKEPEYIIDIKQRMKGKF